MRHFKGGANICRLPVGADVSANGDVHFRVWAPRCREVEVVIDNPHQAVIHLDAESDGYFHNYTSRAKPGDLYRYRLDQCETLLPDPASRFQPDGPLGPSM